jgi:hypothetical protein
MCPDAEEMLVIALRPDQDNRRVVASAGNSAVRASISVSIAAGNQRPWTAFESGGIVDVPVAALPEIIRSSIQPSGIHTICVGVVEADATHDALAMWLTRHPSFSDEARARHETVMANLRDAAARDRGDARDRALAEQQARAEQQASEPAPSVEFEGDPLAMMPTRREFDDALARCHDFVEEGADIIFLEAPESADEMHRFCSEIPRPTMANMIDGGKTPILPPDELERIGYRIAAYPLVLLSAAVPAVKSRLVDT